MKIQLKIEEYDCKNLDDFMREEEIVFDDENIDDKYVWITISGRNYTVLKDQLYKVFNVLCPVTGISKSN